VPEAAPPDVSPEATVVAPAAPAVSPESIQGEAEQQIIVEGSVYRVVLSSRGAAAKSWTLKEYLDDRENPLELINSEAASRYGDPLSIWVADEALRAQVNGALFVPSATGTLQAPTVVSFEYRSGGVWARKSFTFTPDSFVAELESDLTNDGKAVPHELAWRGSFGDTHDAAVRRTTWDVFYRQPDGMIRLKPGDVDGASSSLRGPFPFAGIEDHFFAAAFLPGNGSLRLTAFSDEVRLPGDERSMPSIGVAVGSDADAGRMRLYVGPKQSEILAHVHPVLPDLVDYGYFSIIARPMFWALRWVHDHVVANYGWAIMLVTVVINMLLFPLKLSSMRSAIKMQKLAPQLRAIQEKYKNLKLKDPKRQQMSQETMDLYKRHGVNPIGGCLPMLLQIPFFIGFYNVLAYSIELRHASWINWWVPDLSAPEPLWLKLLPLLMCGTQFVVQKMMPTPSTDPMQQKIMLFMPLMMLGFFYYMASGLVLYWLTGNVVAIAQQWYINQTELKHQIEERKEKAAAKRKRK
jgi:YidC/Oxa1 family membrane protein insertase